MFVFLHAAGTVRTICQNNKSRFFNIARKEKFRWFFTYQGYIYQMQSDKRNYTYYEKNSTNRETLEVPFDATK